MFLIDRQEIKNKVDSFNWNFKVGNNIKHNIEEIYFFKQSKGFNGEL